MKIKNRVQNIEISPSRNASPPSRLVFSSESCWWSEQTQLYFWESLIFLVRIGSILFWPWKCQKARSFTVSDCILKRKKVDDTKIKNNSFKVINDSSQLFCMTITIMDNRCTMHLPYLPSDVDCFVIFRNKTIRNSFCLNIGTIHSYYYLLYSFHHFFGITAATDDIHVF